MGGGGGLTLMASPPVRAGGGGGESRLSQQPDKHGLYNELALVIIHHAVHSGRLCGGVEGWRMVLGFVSIGCFHVMSSKVASRPFSFHSRQTLSEQVDET